MSKTMRLKVGNHTFMEAIREEFLSG